MGWWVRRDRIPTPPGRNRGLGRGQKWRLAAPKRHDEILLLVVVVGVVVVAPRAPARTCTRRVAYAWHTRDRYVSGPMLRLDSSMPPRL